MTITRRDMAPASGLCRRRRSALSPKLTLPCLGKLSLRQTACATLDHAERRVLKGKLATREAAGGARDHAAAGGAPHRSPSCTPKYGSSAWRTSYRERRQLPPGPGSVGFVHSNDEHAHQNAAGSGQMLRRCRRSRRTRDAFIPAFNTRV
jgi:hypothetical protein